MQFFANARVIASGARVSSARAVPSSTPSGYAVRHDVGRSLSGAAAAVAKPVVHDVAALLRRAQSKVFGTDFGDHRRSGRKRLRSHLRGPSVKGYYGFNFDDVLPNAVTTMKEDFFRDEELLNRIGKTRIKGKMKEPLKDMVETMQFEDEVEDVSAPANDCAAAACGGALLGPPLGP
jgi:hypothetical protein